MFRTLIYLLYWSVQAVAFPILLLYLALRVIRTPLYRKRLAERFGFWRLAQPPSSPDRIWLHAVSVGEILTAVPLLRRLRQYHPAVNVYVSCTTLAGREIAEARLADLADGVFYAPIDYRFAVRGVLRRIRPSIVVVMETEIWPNLYRDARKFGSRLLIVNGRISDKAIGRYRGFRWFFGPVLSWADGILAQSAIAFDRYRELGATSVSNAGNLKYDFEPPPEPVSPGLAGFLDRSGASEIWIAASTMPAETPDDPDEDDVFIEVWRDLALRRPGSLAILAPRRPQRFDDAAAKLSSARVPFMRRSQLTSDSSVPLPGVLLLDTMGELAGLFSRAQAVFMGGTMVHRGGHNPLEPAVFAVPVVAGPHMENFQEIADEFSKAGAMVRVGRPDEIAGALERLLSDAGVRARIGQRSREIAEWRRGATSRALNEILRLLPAGLARPCHSWPRLLLLGPLALLWRGGVAAHRWAMSFYHSWLPAPIVSVGNLAMGGTGKTPFVLWLAESLRRAGRMPAVLTRGYRRRSKQPVTIVQPGEAAPVDLTGEEAQMYVRAGLPVGIGRDRWAAGQALYQLCRPQVYLLDDGFQHWALRRKTEIVLVDAIDPFRGGVFPLGRLREPFSALRRAHAVVLTRTQTGRRYEALEAEIRRFNPEALLFYSRLVPRVAQLLSGTPGAFCALGQPASFAQTLAALGIRPAFFEVFPDHHHYAEADLEPLSARAPYLVTTEKDYLNIPSHLAARLKIIPIPIAVEVDDGERLLKIPSLR